MNDFGLELRRIEALPGIGRTPISLISAAGVQEQSRLAISLQGSRADNCVPTRRRPCRLPHSPFKVPSHQ